MKRVSIFTITLTLLALACNLSTAVTPAATQRPTPLPPAAVPTAAAPPIEHAGGEQIPESPGDVEMPAPDPTPPASLFLNVAANSDQGDLSHLTGGHINLNSLNQSAQSLNDLQNLLGMNGRLLRIHYSLMWWAEEPADRALMSGRIDWALEQGTTPLINLFAFPPSWSGCPNERPLDYCKGYPPQDLSHFRQQVSDVVSEVFLPPFNRHPGAPHIYELLNEPDILEFWRGTRQEYLDTLTALKDGILDADPQARFAGPATVGLGSAIQGESIPVSQDFINWFLDTGLDADRLVYFTLHTYSVQVEVNQLQNVPELRQRLDALGLEKTGIVIDEWNYLAGNHLRCLPPQWKSPSPG